MKRNYSYKNTGRFLLATGLLVTTLLSSCLKDNSPGTINFGDSPALVSWQYNGFQATPYIATMLPTGTVKYTNIEVALSVSTVTLKSAVTVNVSVSSAALTAYNTANSTDFTELPSSQYALSSTTVTIPAGTQIVKFPITFQAGAINFANDNAIALVLTGANGASIPSNLSTAIVEVKVKSPYEDNYTASGERTRFNGSTEASGVLDMFPISGTVPLTTFSANEVTGQAGDTGSGYTWALQVNSDNSVTVLPDPTAAAGGTPASFTQGDGSGQSSYDPATKTFTIHCGYLNGAGNLREIDEVLVAQ